jgi:RHS repeat-associated protein
LPVSTKRLCFRARHSWEYNAAGYETAFTDGNKHTTKYSYDSENNLKSVTDPNEHETKWEYNSTHEVISVTTPKGEKTTIKRNSHGDAETVERPAPGEKTQTTKYVYASHGEVESMTDPVGHVWKYEYDTYGDRGAEIDPESDKRTWSYNEDSQLTSTVSPRGHVKAGEEATYTTKIERDSQGRPLTITDPLGHTTKYTYDGDGNVETVTDGNSHKTTYTYNADNKPTKVKEPNGITTETEYNGAGQVVSQTDGNKHETKYVRNVLGEVTETIDPLGRKTTKEYDNAGNLKTLTDPAKRTTTYTYDPGNRLTEVSYSDGKTHAIKYEYDADGDRSKMTDGTGTTTYEYDQLDRVTESKDGHGDVVKYEYNLDNQPTKITYPNGKSITRTYDKAGRLESVSDWLEHTTKFGYDADSDLITTTFPTTTSDVDKYVYNAADQMTEVKITKGAETLASLVYARENVGQVKTITSKGLPGEEKPGYTYDENNRLTKGGATAYEYDTANNPTKIGSGTYAYDKASELEKGPSVTYTYNEVGQRTKSAPTTGSATTYGYDQAGNLISVERPKEGEKAAIEDTYAYDGNNLRASQTISKTTIYLAWQTNEGLPLLLSDGTNNYILGPGGLPIEQISSGGIATYLHHDQQGSTRLLTGSTGTVTGKCTYSAYGTPTCEGATSTPLGYDAQYTSSDTGLIYFRARVYDPATAQFLTVDPMMTTTRAPYTYAEDNPVNRIDPSGLSSQICVGASASFGIFTFGGEVCYVSTPGGSGFTGTGSSSGC